MPNAVGTLLVRADAGPGIGVGHVMRCLALAQVWTKYHGKVVFACAGLPESIGRRLRDEGCEVRMIEARDDAGQTIRLAEETDARWIVVDGYRFGRSFQHGLRSTGRPLLVFDDFGQLDGHEADLLLDQNLGANARSYPNAPKEIRFLTGSRYAQVRREFTAAISRDRKIKSRVKSLLVTLGGADPENFTASVVASLKNGFGGNVTVVVGSANPHGETLAHECAAAGFRMVVDPPNLPDLMREADLAISAAGSTTWELSALGVPAILLVIADNQRGVASALLGRGAAFGVIEDPSQIVHRLPLLLEAAMIDGEGRARSVQSAQTLVDGRGSIRVATRMAARALRIRKAQAEDCEIYHRWANDPVVRANAFDPTPIPADRHRTWFGLRLNSAECRMFLAVNLEEEPVGQIRFDLEDEGRLAVVDVHVAPEFRGAGIGRSMIVAGVDGLFESSPAKAVEARVKRGNLSSQNAFLDADFDFCGEMEVCGEKVMRFRYERV